MGVIIALKLSIISKAFRVFNDGKKGKRGGGDEIQGQIVWC